MSNRLAQMANGKRAVNGLFPKPPAGSPPPPPGADLGSLMAGPIVARADADKDGKVTAAELKAAAGTLFDEFDREKAGKLDPGAFADLLSHLFPQPKGGPPPAPAKKAEAKPDR